MLTDTPFRSLFKAVTNRIVNSIATFTLAYAVTGSFDAAWKLGILDVVVKFILFYVNERIWNKLNIGRVYTQPFVLWFTGLPCSGKTSVSELVSTALKNKQIPLQLLEGQDIQTLFPIKGFTYDERNVYLMRMGYFASILIGNDISVVATFISPYTKSRAYNRKLIKNYIEVYVATPIEECKKRDKWGLYKRAEKGELEHFVGVNETYEVPKNHEITIDLSVETPQMATKKILKYLKKNKYFL